MKFLRNHDRLRRELDLDRVPPAVEARLRRVYAELPGEGPAYENPAGSWQDLEPPAARRLSWPLRGAVAACALLIAAGLLTLGMSIFQYAPQAESPAASQPVAVEPEESAAVELEEPATGYSLHIRKAYSDGENVYLNWEIECPEKAKEYIRILSYGHLMEHNGKEIWITTGGAMDSKFRVFANGERLKKVRDGMTTVGAEYGKLNYNGVYALPKQAEDGEELEILLTLDNLYGITQENGNEFDTLADKIPVNFAEEFKIRVNDGEEAVGAYKLFGEYNGQMEDYYVTEGGDLKILGPTEGWKSTVQLFVNDEDPDFGLRFYRNGELIHSIWINKQEEDRHERTYEDGSIEVFYSHDYGGSFFYMARPEYAVPDREEPEMAYSWYVCAFVSGPKTGEEYYPNRIEIVEFDGDEEIIVDVMEDGKLVDSVRRSRV